MSNLLVATLKSPNVLRANSVILFRIAFWTLEEEYDSWPSRATVNVGLVKRDFTVFVKALHKFVVSKTNKNVIVEYRTWNSDSSEYDSSTDKEIAPRSKPPRRVTRPPPKKSISKKKPTNQRSYSSSEESYSSDDDKSKR